MPDAGPVFSYWGGHCAGAGAATSVLVDQPRGCTATFLGTGGAAELVPSPRSVVQT